MLFFFCSGTQVDWALVSWYGIWVDIFDFSPFYFYEKSIFLSFSVRSIAGLCHYNKFNSFLFILFDFYTVAIFVFSINTFGPSFIGFLRHLFKTNDIDFLFDFLLRSFIWFNFVILFNEQKKVTIFPFAHCIYSKEFIYIYLPTFILVAQRPIVILWPLHFSLLKFENYLYTWFQRFI